MKKLPQGKIIMLPEGVTVAGTDKQIYVMTCAGISGLVKHGWTKEQLHKMVDAVLDILKEAENHEE